MQEILLSPWGPVLIFVARICDVSMATMRLIYAVRGHKLAAVTLGFFEIMIWIVAIGAVVSNLDVPVLAVAYALGFAAGTYVGMTIEEHLAVGVAEVRVMSRVAGSEIAAGLRQMGLGVTEMPGFGLEGPVAVLSSVMQRKDVKRAFVEVYRHDPDAFVTVEEPRWSYRGWMRARRRK